MPEYFWYSLWARGRDPRGETHRCVGPPDDWVSLEFVTLRVVHTGLLAIVNYSCQFSTLALVPSVASLYCSTLWLNTACNCFSLNLGGSSLSWFQPLIQKRVDYPSCSAFCFLLGQSGDFQAPYMWTKTGSLWRQVSYCQRRKLERGKGKKLEWINKYGNKYTC